MKNLRLLLSALVLTIALVFISNPSWTSSACKEFYRNDKTVRIGNNSIKVEAAKTDAQLEKGLGGRSCIGKDEGMLFVFNKPGYYPFWMKDMKFPIDMVWVGASHKVVTVKPDVLPDTYPQTFVDSAPAQYVLEIGQGRAAALGISDGSALNF